MPTPGNSQPVSPSAAQSPATAPVFPETLVVEPIGRLDATVAIPGSKSLTNRALLLAALAKGKSTLTNVLFADDSRRMLEALQTLGFDLTIDEANTTVTVTGLGGRFPTPENRPGDNPTADLFLGNAGTATRFLTAALCLGHEDASPESPASYHVRGIPRMHERPIGQLVEPLRQLGATITCDQNEGFPPLTITVDKPLSGSELTMAPTISSQYISALLQIGPCLPNGLTIHFDGPVISKPYVEMTLALMAQFGAQYQTDEAMSFVTVLPTGYQPADLAIEPDASNATYFLAMAAVTGGRCTIPHLGPNSLQGDAGFARVLEQMGCTVAYNADSITVQGPPPGTGQLRGVDVDLNAMPDTAQTLAAVACFAQGPTTMRDIGNLRVKETDRMAAVQNEWQKLGVQVEIHGDDMTITPAPAPGTGNLTNGAEAASASGNLANDAAAASGALPTFTPATLHTYDDHRMAMSLSVIAAGAQHQPGVITLEDPGCCAKTFPTFFQLLDSLRTSAK